MSDLDDLEAIADQMSMRPRKTGQRRVTRKQRAAWVSHQERAHDGAHWHRFWNPGPRAQHVVNEGSSPSVHAGGE